eukprot:gene13405-28428_t
MTSFTELLGDDLLTKSGLAKTSTVLDDKYVALYFSAHWCPPCRGFTPQLAKFYDNFKSKGKDLEIIFVSSDRDEAQFNEYYSSMPWLALPYSARDKKATLSSQYGVKGIPTLIILNKDGSLITDSGRSRVVSDPMGEQFPWLPASYSDDLGTTLRGKEGEVDVATLAGKYVGLYFSAHWCGPCRKFTPKLASYYTNRKQTGHNDFEIIFISSDQDESEFEEYYQTMPWLTFPFKDPRVEKFGERCGISGIPALIIVDPAGKVVTANGRAAIDSDPEGTSFPYQGYK